MPSTIFVIHYWPNAPEILKSHLCLSFYNNWSIHPPFPSPNCFRGIPPVQFFLLISAQTRHLSCNLPFIVFRGLKEQIRIILYPQSQLLRFNETNSQLIQMVANTYFYNHLITNLPELNGASSYMHTLQNIPRLASCKR